MSDENTGTPSLSDRVDAALSEPPPAALADAPTDADAFKEHVEMERAHAAGEITGSVPTGPLGLEPIQDGTPSSDATAGSFEAILLAVEDLGAQLKAAQGQDFKPLLHNAQLQLESLEAVVIQAFDPLPAA